MSADIGWVKPPRDAQGLDHLGTQAPCIQIYTQLLPGLTNVTNRVRYYSVYPWVLAILERTGLASTEDDLIENFRKSDCLLTLIAERHSRVSPGEHVTHGEAMVGRDTLVPALNALEEGGDIWLSDFATREQTPIRYFKNRLGGLGQYYLGPMYDLGIADGTERPWVRYSKQVGLPLVQAVDGVADAERFSKSVRSDQITLKRLDELAPLCFCALRTPSDERSLLIELLFGLGQEHDSAVAHRRQSLCLLLEWIDHQEARVLEKGLVESFRRTVYCISDIPGSGRWVATPSLRPIAQAWQVYERNDLLSVAVQSLFFAAITLLRDESFQVSTLEDFGRWLAGRSEIAGASRRLGKRPWGETRARVLARAPEIHDWTDERHEEELALRLLELFRGGIEADDAEEVFEVAIRLLMLLASRQAEVKDPYLPCPLPQGYLMEYPVNLSSFLHHSREVWANLDVKEVLVWLIVHWGLETHLHIALRKLRHSSQSTFRVTPTDRGLVVESPIPPPVPTNPRLVQATRALEDLGLIMYSGSTLPTLTDDGRKVLRDALAI